MPIEEMVKRGYLGKLKIYLDEYTDDQMHGECMDNFLVCLSLHLDKESWMELRNTHVMAASSRYLMTRGRKGALSTRIKMTSR
jgi:hypothetical protein